MSAGRAIGNTTYQNVCNVGAPSIRAASSMLTGTVSKNCFMMNTLAASTMSGKAIALYVS